MRLVVAVNAATGEVKYFATNDRRRSVRTVLRVAKQEVGVTHFEGRDCLALMPHLRPAAWPRRRCGAGAEARTRATVCYYQVRNATARRSRVR